MKKITGLLFIIGALSGCGKEIVYSNDFSTAAFINASPGSPSMLVYVDSINQTSSAIAYRGNSGYLSLRPGSRNTEVRSSIDLVTKFVSAPTENFTTNSASTYIIYDTQTVANKTLKTIRLTDNLSLPAPGTMKYRFLNLAVKSTPLDVTFVRTIPHDSITITNQAYIGASPNVATLSLFSNTRGLNTVDTIRLKTAGTPNVQATAILTLGTPSSAPYSVIYTFYATGTAAGQPLSFGAFRHYP
jgi:Domain of unknown function (DUF4397)